MFKVLVISMHFSGIGDTVMMAHCSGGCHSAVTAGQTLTSSFRVLTVDHADFAGL